MVLEVGNAGHHTCEHSLGCYICDRRLSRSFKPGPCITSLSNASDTQSLLEVWILLREETAILTQQNKTLQLASPFSSESIRHVGSLKRTWNKRTYGTCILQKSYAYISKVFTPKYSLHVIFQNLFEVPCSRVTDLNVPELLPFLYTVPSRRCIWVAIISFTS